MYGGGRGYGTPQMSFGPPVTPRVVKNLLIANLVIFVLSFVGQGALYHYGAVRPLDFWQRGYLWQPFTYMWLHSQAGLLHLALNCFVLWMFGSQVAMAWGARRFLRFYVVCGVGAGLIIASWPFIAVALGAMNPLALEIPTVGASGAIYGVMLAYSLIWPDRTIMLIFPPVAFKAIWLIPILFFVAMIMPGSSNVSHVGHLGGVIVGWLYLKRSGHGGADVLSVSELRRRWRRYRMRQKVRAVRLDDLQRKRRSDDERRLH